jgi:hypothetical protein
MKQDDLSPLLFNFSEYPIRKVPRKLRRIETEFNTSATGLC